MEYNDRIGTTPVDIADVTANYYRDTFQPLMDESFNKDYIASVERDFEKVRSAWDKPELKMLHPPHIPLASYPPLGPESLLPNVTDHQREHWDLPNLTHSTPWVPVCTTKYTHNLSDESKCFQEFF